MTTVIAIASKWLLADWPENAKFLSAGEKALLLQKLGRDEGISKMDRLDKQAIKRIIGDWKIWTR